MNYTREEFLESQLHSLDLQIKVHQDAIKVLEMEKKHLQEDYDEEQRQFEDRLK